MKFLVDECAGRALAAWLRGGGHDVLSVREQAPGSDDESVLRRAKAEQRILITLDKDFGDHVVRGRQAHCGIILLRLDDERGASKIARLAELLLRHGGELSGKYVVVTDRAIRFARG